MASGGYWVATSADNIYAQYGSIVGSIGVSGPSWFFYDNPTSISTGAFGQSIKTKNGIEIFNSKAGNSKDLFNPFRKPTKKELNHLQNIVNDIYKDFVNSVSKSRKIENNDIINNIGALIYNSSQAKENFLIDDILNLEQLVSNIVKLENFENYKIIENINKKNLINKYLDNYVKSNNNLLCNTLKSNLVSIYPTYMQNC